MCPYIPAIVTTIGLIFDIVGALLVANEVIRVFREPATIDVGDSGSINGRPRMVPNPKFEAHEQRKRAIMSWGLGCLLIGFILQGLGTWLPILYAAK